MATKRFTVPGLDQKKADQVAKRLQQRLVALIDLELTLKHIHWNVVGPPPSSACTRCSIRRSTASA